MGAQRRNQETEEIMPTRKTVSDVSADLRVHEKMCEAVSYTHLTLPTNREV